MNDTPRTDKFEIDYFNEDTSHVDDVFEYARQLERENAALRAELEMWRDGAIIRKEDHSELLQLRADKERLDWLDKVMNYDGGGYGMKWCFFTPIDAEDVRTAIDAARKETK